MNKEGISFCEHIQTLCIGQFHWEGLLVTQRTPNYRHDPKELTTAQVNEERSVEVFVIDQCCVLAGAARMLKGKVTLFVPAKHVAFLLI